MSLRVIGSFVLVLSMISTSCYDSTWGETKRGQQRNAQAATPASLEPRQSGPPRLKPAARIYHVRVYATPSYVSQSLDWQKKIRDLFEDANDVLTADLNIALDVETMNAWNDAGSEEEMTPLLRALHAKDAGDGVDWVAGFVGGLPKVDPSPHELGMSDEPGKHVVLRAISAANERDSIDHDFDRLSEDQRMRLSRHRKQHRATSVMLHEVGHTLAAVHEADTHTIMNPSYDTRMSAFSGDALSLMHVTIAHRDHLDTTDEVDAYARELLAILQGPSANAWIRSDREDLVHRLEQTLTTTSTAPRAPPTSAPPPQPPPPPIAIDPALAPRDQPAYVHASELLAAGDAAQAGVVAKPLFSAYPTIYAVQDLRCKIAMKRDGWPAAEGECKPLLKLSK